MVPGMDEPPVNVYNHVVNPISLPQVNAPRLIIKNFPKPSGSNLNLNIEDYTANEPVLNASPEMVRGAGSSQHYMGYNGRDIYNRKLKSKKRSRKLDQGPYVKLHSGSIDIGSSGSSNLNYAMNQPSLASLSPFIPRDGPPPSVRVHMQGFSPDHPERKLYYNNERKIVALEVHELKEKIKEEYNLLIE